MPRPQHGAFIDAERPGRARVTREQILYLLIERLDALGDAVEEILGGFKSVHQSPAQRKYVWYHGRPLNVCGSQPSENSDVCCRQSGIQSGGSDEMPCPEFVRLEEQFTMARAAPFDVSPNATQLDLVEISRRIDESKTAVVAHTRTCIQCKKKRPAPW
jgi:hypothetical protein